TFRIDAWSDPWSTWRHAVEVKVGAAQTATELANDLENGALLLDRAARRFPHNRVRAMLVSAAAPPRATAAPRPTPDPAGRPRPRGRAEAGPEPIQQYMWANPLRDLVTRGRKYQMWVDRSKALYGSWYEFFPRSTGGVDESGKPVHGTFDTAIKELDRVARMG